MMSGAFTLPADDEPVACRGCLTTERALRPLTRPQAVAFENVLHSVVSASDVCPRYVCSYCRWLLQKFTAFRARCLSSQTLCQDLYSRGIQASTSEIRNIAQDLTPLQKTTLQNISIEPKEKRLATTYIQRISIDPEVFNKPEPVQENVRKTVKAESIKLEAATNPNSDSDVDNDNDLSLHDDSSDSLDELQKINASTIKKDLDTISNLSDTSGNTILDSSDSEKDSDDSDIALNNFKKKYAQKRPAKHLPNKEPKKIKTENKPLDKRARKTFKKPLKTSKKTESHTPKQSISKTKGSSLKEIQQLIKKLKTENERCKTKNGGSVPKKSRKLGVDERKKEKSEKEYNMKIVQLSKEEQLRKLEARKESLNYKRATYKCDQCFRGFIKEFTYKNHVAKHDPSQGDHVCDVCSLRFPSESSVKKHISSFHEYDYICNECGHVSKYLYSAVVHFRWHKGVKYDCKVCGKTFDKPTSVMGHMHLKHGGTTTCPICDEMFIGDKGLDRHMKMSHKEAIGAVCPVCGVQFHSAGALRRHRPLDGTCDQAHRRVCAACGDSFPTEQLLQQHKDENHKKRGFICETCGKQYGDARSYHGHVTYHLYNKPGTSRAFRANADQPPVTWMCEICGRSYKSKAALNLHHLSHTGEKPFSCDFCQQGYKSKASLQAHISKHTGAPPRYSCNFCHKKFKHDSNRKRHESAVHKKLRPFKCDLCENTYQDKHTLQTHVNTKHHGLPWPKRVRKGHAAYSPTHMDMYSMPHFPK